MKIFNISFHGQPANYGVIDNYLSRSAQPKEDDFLWLKNNGVTDIINLRTMVVPELDFEERKIVEGLGMQYHNIPSYTNSPDVYNIQKFLNIVDSIKSKGGKSHVHCKAGADRTGMYAFIYKMFNNIGTLQENVVEWMKFGHHYDRYPDLINWTKNFVQQTLAKK